MKQQLLTALGMVVALAVLCAQGSSKWVSLGADHKLQYGTDTRGNRIMDFSHAGYQGGGMALPAVRTARTVSPAAGDNTARIQAAIDQVSALAPGTDGFRGAVVLEKGVYDVTGEGTIAASGVVLRGSGSGENGTVIKIGGTPHRFLDVAGAGSWQPDGTPAAITDAYVPSGSTSFTVNSAAGFKPDGCDPDSASGDGGLDSFHGHGHAPARWSETDVDQGRDHHQRGSHDRIDGREQDHGERAALGFLRRRVPESTRRVDREIQVPRTH